MSHWDRPNPHIVTLCVDDKAIDRFNHVNNAAYVHWLEDAAWSHTEALELPWELHQKRDRSFVAHRTELDYLAAGFKGDELEVATWVVDNDRRLTLERAYQIYRPSDGTTLLRAKTRWVCVELSTGKPKRMPKAFVDGYVIAEEWSN